MKIGLKEISTLFWAKFICVSTNRNDLPPCRQETASAFHKLISISVEIHVRGKLDPNSSPENLDSKHEDNVQEAALGV